MSKETITISEFGLIGIEGESNCKGNFLSCEVKADFYKELEEFAKTEVGSDVFQFASNGKCLQAKSFVGTIQTRSGHQLEIIPKTKNIEEVDSSKEILVKLLHLLYKLPNYKHIESAKFRVDRLTIFEIFISMFLQEVGVLIRKGIKSDYNQLEDNLRFMKGKLLIKEQIKYNTVHKERFFVQYDEYTPNRAENRLIKSTLLLLLNLSKDFTNQRLIRQHLEHLHLVDRSINLERDFASVKTGRGVEHYRNALIWCRVFLKKESFSSYSGETIAFAILYPMEKLFEAFVEWYLVKDYSEYKISTQYHLGRFVTKDGNSISRSIKPDFVLEKENKLIIADAKWKLLENLSDISQGDLYQLYSHKSYIKKHKGKEKLKGFKSCSQLFYPKTDYLTENKTLTYFDNEKLIIYPLDLAKELGVSSESSAQVGGY